MANGSVAGGSVASGSLANGSRRPSPQAAAGRRRPPQAAVHVFSSVRKGYVSVKYSGATRARSLCSSSKLATLSVLFLLGLLRVPSDPVCLLAMIDCKYPYI